MDNINFKKYDVLRGKKIYVDGGDFAGKTTFQTNLRKFAIESDVFVNDRTWISSYVYAKYFNRDYCNLDIIKKRFYDDINSNKGIYVILVPTEDEIKMRMNKREEDFIDDKDIQGIHDEYLNFYKNHRHYSNIYLLQQSNPEDYFSLQLESLCKNYGNSQLNYDYNILLHTLEQDCELKYKKYSEIFSYKFTYTFNSLFDFDVKFGRGISSIVKGGEIEDNTNKLYLQEEPERQIALNQLKFNTQINIEKFGDSVESRRLIAHSDSCMSFLQFQIREDSIYINTIWRSSDVKKMLPADFKTLHYIIYEYLLWIKKYKNTAEKNIILDIQLNNCHIFS